MFLLTNLGSKNCLTILIIINKTMIAIPRLISPFKADIIAQGIIKLPEPKIGRLSTKPIASAISNGYLILKPQNCKIYKPNKDITKEIRISIICAFKYPPSVPC